MTPECMGRKRPKRAPSSGCRTKHPPCHHPAATTRPCSSHVGRSEQQLGSGSLAFKSINGDLCRGSAAQGTLYVSLPRPPTCSPFSAIRTQGFSPFGVYGCFKRALNLPARRWQLWAVLSCARGAQASLSWALQAQSPHGQHCSWITSQPTPAPSP